MGVITRIHASKKRTVNGSFTGTRTRQKNFGHAPAVVCNLKGRYMGVTIRTLASRRHTGNAKRESLTLKKRGIFKADDETHTGGTARVSGGFLWLFRACLAMDTP